VAAYYAQFQLGDIALRAREYPAAVEAYTEAIRLRDALLRDEFTAYQLFGLDKGAVENNLALAHILRDAGADAQRQAVAALARDAESPVFQQTLAYAYQSKEEWDNAAATYRRALDADPTLFPAANDLGVILARQGREADALTALRQAVGAKPEYALGWFNLGVLLGRMGPSRFLQAQGALGRAVTLDPGLRDRDRELVFDTDPYFSGLDLSRPLPPQWRFAQHEHRAPAALTILAILLLIGRLLWNVGLDKATGAATEKALGWLAWLRRPLVPAIAVIVLIGLFIWPLIGSPGVSTTEIAVIGAGAFGLTGIYLRSRALAARRSQLPLRHYTWLPSLAIGGVLTAVGLSFAPVPATQLPEERRAVRWIGPVTLAAAAAILLGIAAFTGVPATRALGTSAIVMLGSVLLPMPPFDGAYVRSKIVSVLISLAMLAVSVALLLGLL
jgi:tetratricopeptide (TPR) repeat protein